ncbi:hypothetical protein LCGC14_0313460 [marine sediment metagenome]|uniref:Uncharacterized protein n=1 Tax=marine sediment metagenome TaxID=412755 RepID=A0A0F9TRW4_9ZZZZ
MSILAIYEKIQELAAASSGIASAPTVVPASLNSVSLPMAICIPGEADWGPQAVGLKRHDRTYRILVYVKPLPQGIGIDEGFQEVLPILQAMGDTFNGNLSLDNTVDHIRDIHDSGVRGDMEYAGFTYHGFELSFEVTDKTT